MGNYPRLTAHQCPRCGGSIPNNDNPGAYPGALSRVDNKTEICSDCGTMEAMDNYALGFVTKEDWVIKS